MTVRVEAVETRTLHEGAWPRAWRETWKVVRSWAFGLISVAGTAVAVALTFPFVVDSHHSITLRALVEVVAVALGPVVAFVLVLAWEVLHAPYLQRDEARKQRDKGRFANR